jgi:hypothetical protein
MKATQEQLEEWTKMWADRLEKEHPFDGIRAVAVGLCDDGGITLGSNIDGSEDAFFDMIVDRITASPKMAAYQHVQRERADELQRRLDEVVNAFVAPELSIPRSVTRRLPTWFHELVAAAGGVFAADPNEPKAPSTVPKHKFDGIVAELVATQEENARLRAELRVVATPLDGVWQWQGDGSDAPDGIACPVVMSADRLRALLRERRGPVEVTMGEGGAGGGASAEAASIAIAFGMVTGGGDAAPAPEAEARENAAPAFHCLCKFDEHWDLVPCDAHEIWFQGRLLERLRETDETLAFETGKEIGRVAERERLAELFEGKTGSHSERSLVRRMAKDRLPAVAQPSREPSVQR